MNVQSGALFVNAEQDGRGTGLHRLREGAVCLLSPTALCREGQDSRHRRCVSCITYGCPTPKGEQSLWYVTESGASEKGSDENQVRRQEV